MSATADYFLHGEKLDLVSSVGYVLIAAGFVAISLVHGGSAASIEPVPNATNSVDSSVGTVEKPDFPQET